MTISLYALHGFLGLSSDWDTFKSLKQATHLHRVNLFDHAFYVKGKGFKSWAESFNAHIREKYQTSERVLLGYSLGSRLAMHALLASPTLWSAAILVAGNLGLHSENERTSRREADLRWAEDFKVGQWEDLLLKWNAQSAFGGFPSHFRRNEEAFSREQLVDALMTWSLSNQDNLKAQIQSLNIPILWIVGEMDVKYVLMAQTLNLKHPKSIVLTISEAAHRVPWERPVEFESHVVNFLKTL